jgi:AcrR family transcriptional regulator
VPRSRPTHGQPGERAETAERAGALTLEPARLARAERRDVLLDIAAELVAAGDAESVSMETVAERARVSRPLVYKHFANRTELLAALYKREASLLHKELGAAVAAAPNIEEKFRALVRGALRAQSNRGATFAALRSAGGRNDARRSEQRQRDRGTLRYFAALAVEEFGLDETRAQAGASILLGAIDAVLVRWRARPNEDNAIVLEDTYVALAMGGLSRLAQNA